MIFTDSHCNNAPNHYIFGYDIIWPKKKKQELRARKMACDLYLLVVIMVAHKINHEL